MSSVIFFEARLASPLIVQPGSLCLESVLSAAVYEQTGKFGDDAMPHVPLVFSDHAGVRIYHASSILFAKPVFYSKETIIRRRRREEIGPDYYSGKKVRASKKPSKTNPWSCEQGNGDYKALMNDYRVVNARSVGWFAESEDPEKVADMIMSLSWIGKRRGQGFGQIDAVLVRETKESSALFDVSGMPRRAIPVDAYLELSGGNGLDGVPVAMSRNYAPSAWSREPLLCAVPSECEIEVEDMLAVIDEDGEVFYG